jgi:hypothetical protein
MSASSFTIHGAPIFRRFPVKIFIPPRSTAQLSESLNHQLSLYAIAAGAAGVGLLALSQPAEAKIIYTKTHQVINGHSHMLNLDPDNDGVADFVLINYATCTSVKRLACGDSFFVRFNQGNNRLEQQPAGSAAALPEGAVIKATRPWGKGGNMARVEWYSGKTTHSYGNWINVTNRYLGLKFGIKGKTHYGWACFSVSSDPVNGVVGTLTGYTYETVPNKAIIAGKTKGPDDLQLQSAGLGHLARGASAISNWRVQRVSAPAH